MIKITKQLFLILTLCFGASAQVMFHQLRVIPTPTGSAVGEVDFSSKTNAHVVGLAAPDSVSADILFRLPSGDGSANQCIQTDGSKNLSFGTCSLAVPVVISGSSGSDILTVDQTLVSIGGRAINAASNTATTPTIQATQSGNGNAIEGDAAGSGGGVVGSNSGSGSALSGVANTGDGLFAESGSGYGIEVVNNSTTNATLRVSQNGTTNAIYATSSGAASTINALNTNSTVTTPSINGEDDLGIGVKGITLSGQGVRGISTTGDALAGVASGSGRGLFVSSASGLAAEFSTGTVQVDNAETVGGTLNVTGLITASGGCNGCDSNIKTVYVDTSGATNTCGTTCVWVATTGMSVALGEGHLSANAQVITLPVTYTTQSSYYCVANSRNLGAVNDGITVSNTSTSTVTFNGDGTHTGDHFVFMCVGY